MMEVPKHILNLLPKLSSAITKLNRVLENTMCLEQQLPTLLLCLKTFNSLLPLSADMQFSKILVMAYRNLIQL